MSKSETSGNSFTICGSQVAKRGRLGFIGDPWCAHNVTNTSVKQSLGIPARLRGWNCAGAHAAEQAGVGENGGNLVSAQARTLGVPPLSGASLSSAWVARQGRPFGASLRDGSASLDSPPSRFGFAPIRKRGGAGSFGQVALARLGWCWSGAADPLRRASSVRGGSARVRWGQPWKSGPALVSVIRTTTRWSLTIAAR